MDPVPISSDTHSTPCQGIWTAALAGLAGLPGGTGLNIAHEAVDRHTEGTAGGRVAIRCLVPGGGARTISYRALAALTSRFANLLGRLEIGAR